MVGEHVAVDTVLICLFVLGGLCHVQFVISGLIPGPEHLDEDLGAWQADQFENQLIRLSVNQESATFLHAESLIYH